VSEQLKVSVVSSERVLFEGTARSVVVPSHNGELGILPMHAPLMTLLGKGTLQISSEHGDKSFLIDQGFLQVVENQVRVIAEFAEVA
jgi:F-type H+-transporting ATPase subunit epsilon